MADAENAGPLTRKVLDYDQTVRRLVPTAEGPEDFAPLADLVNVTRFERVGTFLEVQDWQQYIEMLARWGSRTASFDTTVRRISELADLVYYEIEERHTRGGQVATVNSLTVFQFDDDGKICHLDVYLQAAR